MVERSIILLKKTGEKEWHCIEVKCPYCGSTKVYKHGITKSGHQRFY